MVWVYFTRQPEWRNWQTRTTQNRVGFAHEGSIPSFGTEIILRNFGFFRFAGEQRLPKRREGNPQGGIASPVAWLYPGVGETANGGLVLFLETLRSVKEKSLRA